MCQMEWLLSRQLRRPALVQYVFHTPRGASAQNFRQNGLVHTANDIHIQGAYSTIKPKHTHIIPNPRNQKPNNKKTLGIYGGYSDIFVQTTTTTVKQWGDTIFLYKSIFFICPMQIKHIKNALNVTNTNAFLITKICIMFEFLHYSCHHPQHCKMSNRHLDLVYCAFGLN